MEDWYVKRCRKHYRYTMPSYILSTHDLKYGTEQASFMPWTVLACRKCWYSVVGKFTVGRKLAISTCHAGSATHGGSPPAVI